MREEKKNARLSSDPFHFFLFLFLKKEELGFVQVSE